MVAAASYIPQCGDAIWVTLDPQVGHEQAGRRPAIVISASDYNRKVGLTAIYPITNKKKGYPFEVDIPAGLQVAGVILADQMKSIDWQQRKAAFLCQLPQAVLDEVLANIESLLGG
jgi:mRNA interferase MazF